MGNKARLWWAHLSKLRPMGVTWNLQNGWPHWLPKSVSSEA